MIWNNILISKQVMPTRSVDHIVACESPLIIARAQLLVLPGVRQELQLVCDEDPRPLAKAARRPAQHVAEDVPADVRVDAARRAAGAAELRVCADGEEEHVDWW